MKPYYEKDGITLYLGDCLDVLPQLGPVDHVITDPPYSAKTHAGARTITSGGEVGTLIDFESMTADQLRRAFEIRVPKRWLLATMDWRHVSDLEATPPLLMRFVRAGIWIKPDGAPQFTGDRPATGWEMIAILHSEVGKMRWNGGGHRAVWTHNKCNNGVHPTQKPLSLMRELIELFTDEGDTILDPFCGSGTTLVAARELGRKAIGVEISPEYAETAASILQHGVKGTARIKDGQAVLL